MVSGWLVGWLVAGGSVVNSFNKAQKNKVEKGLITHCKLRMVKETIGDTEAAQQRCS